MKGINVQLSEMSEGSVQERFEHEFAEVIKNVMDPNTDSKKKRQVVITIDVTTDEYRDQVYLAAQVKSKLVPRDDVSTKVLIGSEKDGVVVANELKSGEAGQMYFDETDSTLKDDTGTPVDEIEAKQEQNTKDIIDFRNIAKNN
ncbi:hypothetical protein [Enterococcus xiangfangensis]|uniref:hypothetical protein n=1 Tax=Enterococcus xiangfangensis TaxID=1296537 RepID=UPI003D1763F6|nr:hypothetical protein [Enterococcus asini]